MGPRLLMFPAYLPWQELECQSGRLLVEQGQLTGSGVELEGNAVERVALHHLRSEGGGAPSELGIK